MSLVGSTELRFVKRVINIPSPELGDAISRRKEVRLLQSRHYTKLGTYHKGTWSEWADVPLVEPEDEDVDNGN